MSLVRISRSLLDAVSTQLNVLSTNAYRATVEPKNPKSDPAMLDAMYAAAEIEVWKAAPHLKDAMPPKWCVTTNRVDVQVKEVPGQEFQIHKKMVCPPGTSTYGYIDVTVKLRDLPPEFVPRLQEFVTAAGEHDVKYKQVREQVLAFLQSSKSLNDALKKFPDIALYIPQHYLDSANEKTSRSAAKDKDDVPVMEIDRDLIVATGVVGKLQA